MLIHSLSDLYYFLLQSQFCLIVYLHLEINDMSLGESWSIIKNQYAVLVSYLNLYSYYVEILVLIFTYSYYCKIVLVMQTAKQ